MDLIFTLNFSQFQQHSFKELATLMLMLIFDICLYVLKQLEVGLIFDLIFSENVSTLKVRIELSAVLLKHCSGMVLIFVDTDTRLDTKEEDFQCGFNE